MTPEVEKLIIETRAKYEFMSFLILEEDVLFGIIQQETQKLYMLYQFDLIRHEQLQQEFLQHGDEWWWGSNHRVPINAFIGEPFDKFAVCLKGYPKKMVNEMIGPSFNLADHYLSRIKKRRVEIINRPMV